MQAFRHPTVRLYSGGIKPLFSRLRAVFRDRGGEILFYTGFLPLLWTLLWKTTAFVQFDRVELYSMIFFTACIGLKMIFFDRWRLKGLLLAIVLLIVALLSYRASRFTRPLVVTAAVLGARGLDGRRILKVWLLFSVVNLVLAISAALLGIIPNYSRSWDESYAIAERVYSIGITNTTDCAARIFFTLLVWFYLRGEKLTAVEYAAAPVLGFITYYFTGGRIDSGCVIIMTVLFLTVNLAPHFWMREKSRTAGKKFLQWAAFISIPLFAALALYLVISYRPGAFRDLLDQWSSHRFSIGHRIYAEHGVRLFGKPIQMYGNGRGGFNKAVEGIYYSFIDISYQSVLMLYGAVFFAVMIALYLYLTYRRREDRYLMISVILIAFNCFFAHHLTEIAYIPFVLLALAGKKGDTADQSYKKRRLRIAEPGGNS